MRKKQKCLWQDHLQDMFWQDAIVAKSVKWHNHILKESISSHRSSIRHSCFDESNLSNFLVAPPNHSFPFGFCRRSNAHLIVGTLCQSFICSFILTAGGVSGFRWVWNSLAFTLRSILFASFVWFCSHRSLKC